MKKNTILRKASLLLATILTVTSMAAVNVSASTTTLEQAIINGVNANQSEIDISSLNVAPQDAVNTFVALKSTEPELFCVDSKVNCTYTGSKAKSLVVNYTASKSEIEAQKKAIDTEVSKIAQAAAAGKTQEEKAQIVHDYFVSNTSYDFSMKGTSVYDILVNKKGVCVAYAHAYKLVMEKLGIPCEMAISTQMAHAWNVVQIDGKWYNVDVTYDVTSGGGNGNFLKSDAVFTSTGHSNWVSQNGITCTDTKYDSNF